MLANGTHYPLLPSGWCFRVTGFTDRLHPTLRAGIIFQRGVKPFAGHESAKIDKRGGICGILFVSGTDPSGTQQVVLSHDPEKIIEEPAVAAGARAGFEQGNTQDYRGRNTIGGRKGVGQWPVSLNKALWGGLCLDRPVDRQEQEPNPSKEKQSGTHGQHHEFKDRPEIRIDQFPTLPPEMTDTTTHRRTGWDILAVGISWIFHPVFQPVMLVAFLIFGNTSILFLGFQDTQRWMILAQAFTLYTFFPLVTVGLLKALGFIESIQLQSARDRIIPLVASGVWYFWVWYVWKNLPDYPIELVRFALAAWTVSWIALMINARMKISLHTLSAGLILAFICLWSVEHPRGSGIILPLTIFLAGCIGAARLQVSDHRPAEVYLGYAVGIGALLLTYWIY